MDDYRSLVHLNVTHVEFAHVWLLSSSLMRWSRRGPTSKHEISKARHLFIWLPSASGSKAYSVFFSAAASPEASVFAGFALGHVVCRKKLGMLALGCSTWPEICQRMADQSPIACCAKGGRYTQVLAWWPSKRAGTASLR